jgi:hypothetical protein
VGFTVDWTSSQQACLCFCFCFCFAFLRYWGFFLRTSCLLDRHCYHLTHSTSPFCLGYFWDTVSWIISSGLPSNCDSPYLYLWSWLHYRLEQPVPLSKYLYNWSTQCSISVGSTSTDSTNCEAKIFGKHCVCTKHVQTFSLSLSNTTMFISFTW